MAFGRRKKDSYEIEALLQAVRDLKRENGELQQRLLRGGAGGGTGGDYSIIGLSDGILKLNPAGEVAYMNTCLAELLGMDRNAALGRTLVAVDTDPVWGAGFLAGLAKRADRGGGETAVRAERAVPGGETLYYYITVRPLNDGGRQFLFENVSHQRRAELELKEKESQLRESQKMQAVGTLAGGVAHDFNNLLTIIQVNAELLEMEAGTEGSVGEYIDEIRQTVHNAGNLARQLLVFSRRKALSFRHEDLGEIAGAMMKMLGRVLGEKIRIETEFPAELPAVHADRGSIEQVLLNLAINARDAMPGGGTLAIRTGSAVGGGADGAEETVWLQVTDTGTGMSAGTRQRIFEPFFTTKGVGNGTGLGLSVVYGIVREHNGRIEVESEEGEGTSFRVFLPVPAGTDDEETDNNEAVTVPGGSGERVLLVEDNADVRRATADMLVKSGYVVDTAADAAEADVLLRKNTDPRLLLLCDVVLPDGSGMTVADTARERFRIRAVVLCSSHLDESLSEEVIRDRGYAFIRKPFNRNDLLRAVRTALDASVLPGTDG